MRGRRRPGGVSGERPGDQAGSPGARGLAFAPCRTSTSGPSSPRVARARGCGRCRAPGRPKFLHDLTGSGRSLLQATWDRLEPLTGDAGARRHRRAPTPRPWRAAARAARRPAAGRAVAARLDGRDRAGPQPCSRPRDPDVVLGSFAADHVIGDEEDFRALRDGRPSRRPRDGYVVTIGIEPTHRRHGFRLRRDGRALGAGAGAAPVAQFVEKPDRDTRRGLPRDGPVPLERGHVRRPGRRCCSDLLAAVAPRRSRRVCARVAAEPVQASTRSGPAWRRSRSTTRSPSRPRPQGRVAVVAGGFGWDDVGDFASLGTLLADARRSAGRAGPR